MKHIALAVAVLVSVAAFGAEYILGSLSGTNTQTLSLGSGSTKLAIQCTTPVRYRLSRDAAATVLSTDALVATGDPYQIPRGPDQNRLNIAHQDTTTSISCNIYRVSP